jgi:hypothetical protein
LNGISVFPSKTCVESKKACVSSKLFRTGKRAFRFLNRYDQPAS